jgi:phage-related protein
LKRIPAAFFRSGSDVEPVRDWLKSLPVEDRRIVGFDIATVEFGWPVGMPLCRPLGAGLWEVRSTLTQGRIVRVIFCIADGQMVLLHALIKKDPEDPGAGPGRGPETAEGDRAMTKTKHIGSSFADFLHEEGLFDDATAHAIKRVFAWQIEQAMTAQHITKSEMAKRMKTSRAQLDRLLDPDNDKVQLDTMQRAATAVGRKLQIELT